MTGDRLRFGGCCIALATALAVSAAPMAALAQAREHALAPLTPPPPPAPPAPPPDDGLGQDAFYIEADQLIDNQTTQVVTAVGHVKARYEGRDLTADQVSYDRTTGVVTATGNVAIVNADGTSEFAQSAVLDREMSAGVATAFSTHLQQDVTVMAANVVRKSATYTEFNRAVFTPCPVCAKQPTPTYSVRATKIVDDKKRHVMIFHNAVIAVRKVPVFYFPVIWGPDPESKRKSGLLMPALSDSTLRGFSYEQPYLQVLSPSSDLVVSPQFNQKVNPFLNLDLRKRFYSGSIEVRAGGTYDQDFGSNGAKFGPDEFRGYVLAKGLFAIDPNWRWGFTVEHVNDLTIFDKYGVPDTYLDRGLYGADDLRLISQFYVTEQNRDTYFSIAALGVQGLRSTDVQSTIPIVAPLIEFHFDPDQPVLGGRLRLDASGVVLTRDESPDDLSLPGVDSRRGTAEASWRRTFIFDNGIRFDPFLDARIDLYSLSDLPAPFAPSATIERNLETAGFNLTWPFVKRTGSATWIIEPIAQLALSPYLPQDPRIPNEDSPDFEFDATNLFQVDKSPGYDLVDSGQRLTVGGEANVVTDSGLSGEMLLGREFRAEPDPSLPVRTGLSSELSDWIVGAQATPIKNVTLFARWRLDTQTFDINRLEAGADWSTPRFDGQLRYLQEAQDPTGQEVQDLDFHAELFVLKNWGVTAYGAREFTTGVWRERDFGIVYKDQCLRVEIIYRSDNTTNGALGPSHGFGIRLTLATLNISN
ncbi:MAG TPA: LPS assembly protein LptD [Caulobacteraceae bacterium]